MADPRTIGKWVGGSTPREAVAGELAIWEPGKLAARRRRGGAWGDHGAGPERHPGREGNGFAAAAREINSDGPLGEGSAGLTK
jgi:hypothetical protein